MIRRLAWVGTLLTLLVGAAGPALGVVRVTAAPTALATRLGQTVRFSTTIANDGRRAEGPLVAHLNILSLRPGVYVDPEDWSSARTRYLPPVAPGDAQTLTWEVKAVNSGTFSAYVAAVRPDTARPPIASPAVTISVASRRTLNSGGILPLAIGIPLLLGTGAGVLRLRRRTR